MCSITSCFESRDVFRTQSNIYDGAFLRKQFPQKSFVVYVRQVLNTPLKTFLKFNTLMKIGLCYGYFLVDFAKTSRTLSAFLWKFLISYFFSVSRKFVACYITGQWSEFTIKNNSCFYHFCFFFDKVLNFRNRVLINVSVSSFEYYHTENQPNFLMPFSLGHFNG